MHIVIYSKILDGKKKGIDITGPFQGPECATLDEAHEQAREISKASKDIVLIRVYSLDEYTYEQAKETAKVCFDNIYSNMIAAESILERPSIKSKKKKAKAKAKANLQK